MYWVLTTTKINYWELLYLDQALSPEQIPSIIMSGYIILDLGHHLLGLESILVEAMINISKELKFEGLLLDVY